MIQQPLEVFAQIKDVVNDPRVQEPLNRSISLYLSNLGWLKAIGLLLSMSFVAATVLFAVRTGWLALRVDRVRDVILKTNLPKKRSIKAWQVIQKNFFSGDDPHLKVAIIEADNLLDEALKLAGFRAPMLGDKLKMLTEAELPGLNQVWEAHKLRNRIAHESGFKLNRDMAERALAIYEQTFKDLGLLE